LGPNPGLMAADRTVLVATHHLPNDIHCAELRIDQPVVRSVVRSEVSAARHELQGQEHEHQGNDLGH
jgi:hypothetical protein